MTARFDRLPKRREGERKIPDFSLLSPEKQDRASELLRIASEGTKKAAAYSAFVEFKELVRDLPLLGRNDPEQGPLIEVPEEHAGHWQWHQSPSKWPSLDFYKLTKVQTVRFNALCERYGFRPGGNPYRAQMPPMHTWQPKDR